MKFHKIFGCNCCGRRCSSTSTSTSSPSPSPSTIPTSKLSIYFLLLILSLSLFGTLGWIWFGNRSFFGDVTNKYGDSDAVDDDDDSDGYDADHDSVSEEFVVPFKINDGDVVDDDDDDDDDSNNENDFNKFSPDHETNINYQTFRSVNDQLWDPHPIYVLDTFGHELILELRLQTDLAIPDYIDHVLDNGTQFIQKIRLKDSCFYDGKVRYDPDSHVHVSLCDGMTGYIRARNQSYYIEPVNKNDSGHAAVENLHRVRKVDLFENNEKLSTSGHWDGQTKPLIEKNRNWFEQVTRQTSPNNITDRNDNENNRRQRHSRHRRDIYLYQKNYVIELLFVVDHHLIRMHNNSDETLVHYILTLISHTQYLLKDSTIGSPITIALVKIVVQTVNVFGLPDDYSIGTSSIELRKKFCDWQHLMYSNKIQYDAAIFLTKNVICTKENGLKCSTLGIAELGTMCTPKNNCAVVKDTGLATSYTIAHEIGHLLGMIHDNDELCERINNNVYETPEVFLMNAMFNVSINYWKWSKCSQQFLTNYLHSNSSWCLANEASRNLLATEIGNGGASLLPGEYFNNNRQCEIMFGSDYEICPYMKHCSVLFCQKRTRKDFGCTSNNMPWADGTKCAPNKWCYHGACVESDRENVTPVDGGWSEWKEYSECTLPCGGGVQESKRACDSPEPKNGGSFCIGHSIRYRSCNTHNCPINTPDMREILCAEFNGRTMGIKNLNGSVRWEPKYGLAREDSCKLYCKIAGNYAYHLLSAKVRDGVKCGRDTYDICVGGVCQSAGCDNVLSSTARFDQCGVCKGNNTNCETIVTMYNETTRYGYTDIFTIREGSTNIDIRQTSQNLTYYDTAYLVLKDTRTGHYVLNGNNMISGHSKQFLYGGLKFEYSGGFTIYERVYALTQNKSITRDLTVGIFAMDDTVTANVASSFQTARKPQMFFWKTGPGFCRDICTHGTSNDFKCINDLHQVGDSAKCGTVNIEKLQKACLRSCYSAQPKFTRCFKVETQGKNQMSSPYLISPRWHYGDFGKCLCNGTRTVQLKCVNVMQENRKVAPEQCADQKPIKILFKNCTVTSPECYKWSVTDWGVCSAQCGLGIRYRSVYCQKVNTNSTVDDSYCSNVVTNDDSLRLRPAHNESCLGRNCNAESGNDRKPARDTRSFQWRLGDWSLCSKKCGSGWQQRIVRCQNMFGVDVDAALCSNSGSAQPQSIISCNRHACPQWQYGGWTTCDSACKQFRFVICRNRTHDNLPDAECQITATKPETSRRCDVCVQQQVVDYQWRQGRWSNCSQSCGYGFRRRPVHCSDSKTNRTTDYRKCDYNKKPKEFGRCNLRPCRGPKRTIENHQVVCSCNIGPWGACEPAKTGAKFTQKRIINCRDRESGETINWNVCRKQEMYKKTKKRRRCYRSCKELKTDRKLVENGEHFLYLMNATKKARIFCAQMNTIEPLEFISLIGGRRNSRSSGAAAGAGGGNDDENYSEFYDLIWNSTDQVECEPNRRCLVRQQCVRDSKISYAYQQYGHEKIPFANAGDCFTAKPDCAHGQFSINLRSTNFWLSNRVVWEAVGSFSSAHVQILDREQRQVVRGRCGGYCGKCRPNPEHELRLEIF